MKKYSRILALALVLLMAMGLFLAGCAEKKADDPTPPPEETTDTGTEDETPTPPPEEGGEVEEPTEGGALSLWTWKLGYVPGFEEVGKLAGLEMDITPTNPDDAYSSKVKAAANAKTLPDVVHYWAGPDSTLSDALINLNTVDSINNDEFKGKFFASGWRDVTLTQAVYDARQANPEHTTQDETMMPGTFLGVPFDVGGFYTIFANKKLLEANGIATDVPKTWEELEQRMVDYKEKSGSPALCLCASLPDLWRNWIWSALEIMYNGPEGYEALLNRTGNMMDDKYAPAAGTLESLAKKELIIPGSLALTIDEGDQKFSLEEGAFLVGGSFTAATLIALGMPEEDFYSFPVPPLEGSKLDSWKLTPFPLTMLSLPVGGANEANAYKYIETYATVDGAIAFANAGFSVPAVQLGDRTSELPGCLANVVATYVTDGSDPLTQIDETVKLGGGNEEIKAFQNEMIKVIDGSGTTLHARELWEQVKAEQIEADLGYTDPSLKK